MSIEREPEADVVIEPVDLGEYEPREKEPFVPMAFEVPPDVYALRVDDEGVVISIMKTNLEPEGFEIVDAETYAEAQEKAGRVKFIGGKLVEFEPPAPEVVIRVAKADIWRRATDAEAEVIQALKAGFKLRLRMIFEDAQELRSTDEYWPTLFGAAEQAFGKKRAEELLAPSI